MNPLRELIDSTPLAPLLEARRLVRLPRFRAEIETLAAKLDQPVAGVALDAERRLREMVSMQAKGWTWLWDHAMGPAHTRAFTVDADSAAIARLKVLNQKHALVFLPSHRSYADPFVLGQFVIDKLPERFVEVGLGPEGGPLGRWATHECR